MGHRTKHAQQLDWEDDEAGGDERDEEDAWDRRAISAGLAVTCCRQRRYAECE